MARCGGFSHVCGPVYDEHGVFQGVRGSNRDITESKRVEAAFQESEQRYRTAEELAALGHWWRNYKTQESYWSDGFCHIFGFAPGEHGDHFEDFLQFVHPEDRERVRLTAHNSLSSGQPLSCEFRVVRKGGTLRHLYALATPLRDAAGEFVIHSGIIRDITDCQQAEDSLRESEERYRSLFNGMTEGFAIHEIITDEQGTPVDYRFLDVNPAFERLTGLKRAAVVGKRCNEVLPGDDPKWVRMYGAVALTGEPVQFESCSPVLKRHCAVLAYRPAPRQFAVIFMDITERKRAEVALQESEQRHRAAEKLALLGHWWNDYETDTSHWSEGLCHIFGLAPEENVHPFAADIQFVHPEDRRFLQQAVDGSLSSGQPLDCEFRIVRKDGTLRHVRAHATMVRRGRKVPAAFGRSSGHHREQAGGGGVAGKRTAVPGRRENGLARPLVAQLQDAERLPV